MCIYSSNYEFNEYDADAAMDSTVGTSAIGIVIRDSQGNVMASLCSNLGVCYQPQIAEALGILRGLFLARETGLFPAILESDALSIVDLIASPSAVDSDVGVLIHDIRSVLAYSNFFSVAFSSRLTNKVAHGLAKLALGYVGEFVWMEDCPLAVESLVSGDFPGSL